MYKLCAFDLDGTLVNTINDIADAVNRSLLSLGCPTHSESEYLKMVGDGMRMLCVRALPENKKDLTDELVRRYASSYIENCCVRSELYPGVARMLNALHAAGIRCAVASNKPDPQTRRVVQHYLADFSFAQVLGQRDEIPRKPAPDMLVRVMDACGVLPQETIYIGDSNVDVRFAHAAGVKCIGAAWGFRGRDELEAEGADLIAETPDEIEKLLV